MTSIFPSVLTSYTNPLSTDRLNSPSHSGIEINQNSGVSQLERVVGVEGASSVVGTLQYLIKSPASNGGGHIQAANTGGTGQTNFTKGDILVGQSLSVLTKLAVGTDGQFLVANSSVATGVSWGGNFDIQNFSVSGVWVKPTNAKLIVVTGIGMGASGGDSGLNNPASYGGGGGAGAIDARTLLPQIVTPSVAVTIGTGTISSVATKFGTYFSVAGGTVGGTNVGGGTGGIGGPGGATGISGGNGGTGSAQGGAGSGSGGGAGGSNGSAGGAGGAGGTSYPFLGSGGQGTNSVLAAGVQGSVYGGGASGGSGGTNTNAVGGPGTPGFLSVISYL